MNKTDRMYQHITHHGEDLKRIFSLDNDPIELCKKLRRIENKIHRAAEDYCNGLIDGDEWERQKDRTLVKLDQILGFHEKGIPVLINGDPRGYALKIDDAYVKEHRLDIHRDFGGYGILAPDYKED